MTPELYFLFWMSVITFGVFGLDKMLAVLGKSRVPEALLFVLAALDGAFGALCGMLFFRHKTQHKTFMIVVPLLLGFWMLAHILCRLFITGS